MNKTLIFVASIIAAVTISIAGPAFAEKKPNIVVIWGDDIGYWNISAYNQGMRPCRLFTNGGGDVALEEGEVGFPIIDHQLTSRPVREGLARI